MRGGPSAFALARAIPWAFALGGMSTNAAACSSGGAPSPASPGLAAISAPPACAAGETANAAGDRCNPAGVAADECGAGFLHDGHGVCEPILPDGVCPPGTMALPGETACREVAACGDGPWGDIPVDEQTVYVDASATVAHPDGSRDAPWTTLGAAVDAAPAGALVAVAAGEYAEPIRLRKPLRIWGRCPRLVVLPGTGQNGGTTIRADLGAAGSEMHTFAVTRGEGISVQVPAVAIDRVYVHDVSGSNCIAIEGFVAPVGTSDLVGSLQGSLLEGVFAGSALAIDAGGPFLVRDTAIRARRDALTGDGIVLDSGHAELDRVVIEQVPSLGIEVEEAGVTIDGAVIRDTGFGLNNFGAGIVIDSLGRVPELVLRRSLVERTTGAGVILSGAAATIDATVVRRTTATPGAGGGIYAEPNATGSRGTTLTIRRSTIDLVHTAGLVVTGSTATIDGLLVRQPLAGGDKVGRGIDVHTDSGLHASATIAGSAVEAAHDAAVVVVAADVALTGVALRATDADGDPYGDGLAVSSGAGPTAHVRFFDSLVVGSSRAAITSFAAAVEIGRDVLDRNPIDLDGEFAGFAFTDDGGNTCIAPDGATRVCQTSSAGLAPPSPIGAP